MDIDTSILYFMAFISLVAGVTILIVDVRAYKQLQWRKERIFSVLMAYFNLALGVLTIVGCWIFNQLVW